MDKFFCTKKMIISYVFFVSLIITGGLLFPAPGLSSENPGLKLNLYADREDARYPMGEAIKIIMVIENITRWPINVPRDFSQIELHRSLVITDPGGEKHTLSMEEISTNMPPPFFWNDMETAPAEVLDSDWARTVTIDDLGLLFGMITERPGIYTVEARQSFVMFPWTIQNDQLGLMGIVDQQDPKYWEGTIPSENVLKIIVTPADGAQFTLRALDLSLNAPAAQTPIRIYRKSDLPPDDTYEDIWTKKIPYLTGTTDFQGWIAWDSGRPCIPKDEYLAIGYYQNEYKSALFEVDSQEWQKFCGGYLERRIFFKEQKHEFSVFGLNSVLIRNNARIESGDIGAQSASAGPWLMNGYEVAFEGGTWVNDGLAVKSDSVYIESKASVWDVHANDIDGGGIIRGEEFSPLGLPVWAELPGLFPALFKPSTKKQDDKIVESQGTLTLSPSEKFRDVILGSHAKLILESGVYHLRNLILGSHSRLICLGPVELRIAETLESASAKAAYLGPEAGSGYSAKDVVIYVAGESEAVLFGQGVEIRANIYAKNGSLSTGEGCTLTGSFIAKDVSIGQKSVVRYEGFFTRDDPPPQLNNVPVAAFGYQISDLKVTFTDQSSDSDGSIVAWSWDFGDGNDSTDASPVHDYSAEKMYTVILTVIDDSGESNKASQIITVSIEEEIISLSVVSRKEGANTYADLSWNGAMSTKVEIVRDEGIITTIEDVGFFSYYLGKKFSGQVKYKVCNPETYNCSDTVEANF